MKTLLTVAGVLELATGLALLVVPATVARLLLGAEPVGVGLPTARVAGIALMSLGVGCCVGSVWLAMWLYTALVALFLIYLGVATEWHGRLLWPAVAAHIVLTAVLARRPRFKDSSKSSPSPE